LLHVEHLYQWTVTLSKEEGAAPRPRPGVGRSRQTRAGDV
jgi:hypothetical protein